MKFFIERLYFINRAPFDLLDVDLSENDVAVLSAGNGRGKSTVLTHIVDAFHEIAKKNYSYQFKGKENLFYRVVSGLDNLDIKRYSVFYLRARLGGELIDYINVIGTMEEDEYNELPIDNKISYSKFSEALADSGSVKFFEFSKGQVEALFGLNVATFFPAYRYEKPGYINDPYEVQLSFAVNNRFKGSMTNPLEVVSGLPSFANWLMDVVLDLQYEKDKSSQLLQHLNNLVSLTLSGKKNTPLRFGVGPRGFGKTRIQVVEVSTGETVYPTIFSLSSGEAAMLCMFGEIIRQADAISNNVSLAQVCGVVLIDEIDKHLHIRLQREALPKLIQLFPNVQFLITSHSPFFSMGLAETIKDRSKIIDLENFGVYRDPASNELYKEVYDLMVDENSRFKDFYFKLKEKARANEVPLIVSEGKTDILHLQKAKEVLGWDTDLDFFEVPGDWGDSKLKQLLDQLAKVPQIKPVIGIFDRDVKKIVSEIESEGLNFKDMGNNVYAFCLPVPVGRESYENISIEFYYSDIDLKKEKNGKRIFFDNEVAILSSASNRAQSEVIKRKVPLEADEYKKKVFDSNVGSVDWMHSKAKFAELVSSDPDFANGMDFGNFKLIFEKIDLILDE